MKQLSVTEQILDKARWAPSGDNVQSWAFEIVAPLHVVVHTHDTRHDCVYDLDGHPSQISFGALLETMAIAASGHALRMRAERRRSASADDPSPVFDVHFSAAPELPADPLIDAIEQRTVQRRPMRTRRLTAAEKQALERAVGDRFQLSWLETFSEKWRAARLMYNNAHLRLTMPEAFEVHRRIIDWGTDRSADKVPDQALGVDAATLRLMKWAMVSWERVARVNTLMGTWAPRLQMDLLPGIACGAHFVLKAKTRPASIDDYVAAGRAVQRFWLTLTHLGLFMQPEMTPLIFTKYISEKREDFTRVPKLRALARALHAQTTALIFTDAAFPVYMGRIGAGPAPRARSVRKELDQLMLRPAPPLSPGSDRTARPGGSA